MPLLTLVLGVKAASPLVALNASVINFILFLKFKNKLRLKEIFFLSFGALITIPLGTYSLKYLSESLLRLVLSFAILTYIFTDSIKFVNNFSFNIYKAFLWGLVAGFFAGSINANGPIVIIYSRLRNFSKEDFRKFLANFFFIMGIFVVMNHFFSSNINVFVLEYFLLFLMPTIVSLLIGLKLFGKLSFRNFEIAIKVFLIFLTIILLIKL